MTEVKQRMFRTTFTVSEGYRVLVLTNGKFKAILQPGRQVINSFGKQVEWETFDLNKPEFTSTYSKALMAQCPELDKKHFTVVQTTSQEVAIVERDGKLFGVLKPDGKTIFWTDSGPWKVVKIEVSESLMLEEKLAQRIATLGLLDRVKRFNVEEGQKGLLYIENVLINELKPGSYSFWNVGRAVKVKIVDMRETSIDVSGQEILTKDRVSIRVNIAATYQVTDAVKAETKVVNFVDTLYRALQHGFRESMGTKTFDKILADKVSVDSEAAKRVRDQMNAIGIRVGDIAIKDIILPGEMREILNKVVEAEKESEANVIRRREETNATRALLNTAKVMEENPSMMRLKELEALEKIAEKVQTLTVHNGTQGLLEDIVSLRTEPKTRPAKPAR